MNMMQGNKIAFIIISQIERIAWKFFDCDYDCILYMIIIQIAWNEIRHKMWVCSLPEKCYQKYSVDKRLNHIFIDAFYNFLTNNTYKHFYLQQASVYYNTDLSVPITILCKVAITITNFHFCNFI